MFIALIGLLLVACLVAGAVAVRLLFGSGGSLTVVASRSLLRDCSCGRAYIAPPAGEPDPGTCVVCRFEARMKEKR